MCSSFTIKEHVIDASHIREYAHATAHSQEEVLKLAIKQYTPKDNPDPQPGDITVISSPANGFPKELYEPLWEDLLVQSRSHSFKIRSIWIADVAWQGQSGILNADKLGNDPSWNDHTRDLLHMINHFRLPRPLVGIAHSFGGAILTNLALFHPRLFHSLVLLDPVMSRFASTPTGLAQTPAMGSIYRRDIWPSREDAAASFRRSPFYKAWDPRVLNAWIEHGLTDTPTKLYGDEQGKTTLTTTKHQEVFTFFRPSWNAVEPSGKIIRPELVPDIHRGNEPLCPQFPVYRPEGPLTVVRLPALRPSVFYLFGTQSYLSIPELRQEKMETTGIGVGGSGGAARGQVAEVLLDAGHLFPMEIPGVCAAHAASWIGKEVRRWKEEEREYGEWTKKSQVEKSVLSDDWRKYFPRPGKAKM